MRPLLISIALTGLLAAGLPPAALAQAGRPADLQPIPEPPPPPAPLDGSDVSTEPQVTIIQRGDNKVEDVYQNKEMKNQHGGVVLIGDHLYGHSDGTGWVCQDFMTGKSLWTERRKFGKGAISAADGMLYVISEDQGEVALVEASPEGWNEKGRFKLEPQTSLRKPAGRIWTHPVIANGRLYLRDQELITCFDIKAK